MCNEFKCLETLEFGNELSKGFALEYSDDGHISITTDVGIYIFHLCLKPGNASPSICFKKFYLPVEQYCLSTKLDIQPNKFAKALSREEFYELCLSLDLSPKFYLFNEIESKVHMSKWSSSNIDKANCVLGVLNNTGSLNIYARTFTYSIYENYTSICNLSERIIMLYKSQWKSIKHLSPTAIYEELKTRAQIKPTVFTWSKQFRFESNTFCLLTVGHLNGDMTIWKLSVNVYDTLKEVDVKCIIKINTNLQHITALHLRNTKDRGLILVGDFNGNVTAIPLLHIKDDDIKLGEIAQLYMKNDKIKVEDFYILCYNNFMYIICIKSDFLLIHLLNKNGDILDSCTFQVGNLNITGVEKINENTILVATITGLMKEIKLSCKANKIELLWKHIYININWSIKRAHGLVLSRNKVLLCVLTYPCRIKDKKDDKNYINLVLFENASYDPIKLLLNNTTNTICNFWDCFEVLRVTSLLNKRLPRTRLTKSEDYDDFSFIKLKTYLHITKICEILYEHQEFIDNDIDVKAYEVVRTLFTITLIICRMKYLLDLHLENKINEFQFQNLFILNNYLKEFILIDENVKLIQKPNISRRLRMVMERANELEYPEMPQCFVCDNRIMDSSCLPQHFESRCSISLMPLDCNVSYKCPFCKCRVHKKIEEEVDLLLCPFCDVAMDLRAVQTNVNSTMVSCNADCDREVITSDEVDNTL